jgi:hypothetical protein
MIACELGGKFTSVVKLDGILRRRDGREGHDLTSNNDTAKYCPGSVAKYWRKRRWHTPKFSPETSDSDELYTVHRIAP